MGSCSDPGIIRLVVSEIFELTEKTTGSKFEIECRYFEIYQKEIYNLLKPGGKVANVGKIYCRAETRHEALELLADGNKRRNVGSTKANEKSSRSHAIFEIRVESESSSCRNAPSTTMTSSFSLGNCRILYFIQVM